MHHPDCQSVPDGDAERARPAGQPPTLKDLTDYQREVVQMRIAHLLEAETWFRSGDPLHPGPGEPRPLYDPRRTTLGQRRRAKAAELRSLGADEAAMLGLGQVSERTLKRMAAAWRDRGPVGCIDRRWLRAGGGHPIVTEELREVIFAVRKETKRRSKTGMQDKCVLIAQYAAEKFGPQVQVPSWATGCAAPACWRSPRRTSNDRRCPGTRSGTCPSCVLPAGAGAGPDDLEGLEPVAADPPGLRPRPVITAQEHAQMNKRQRHLHDLHRVSTHSNLAIQETPMSAYVSRRMRSLVESNAFCHGPETRPGLMVNGGGCQGKTETVCEALACFEDEWLALYAQNPSAVAGTLDQHAPVAYVRTPVKATPIATCQRILDFYGKPYKGMRQEDLIRTVKNAVYDHGTKALAIDDITRLKMHREADQDVLDLIRELMSLPVTLILIGVGIPKSGLLRDGRRDPRTGQWLFPPVKDRGKSRNDDAPGQTDLRFDLVDLDRFTYGTADGIAAWTAHLVGVEQQLRLLHGHDGMLSGGGMPEYLFRRTGGIVGLLRKLIQEACRHAIEAGAEKITTELLDTLALRPSDLPGLDPAAGEVPDIPADVIPPQPKKKRRPRNTVFDDHGGRSAG